MSFDENKNRQNPNSDKEPISASDQINNVDKSGADGVSEHNSEPAAEFVLDQNSDNNINYDKNGPATCDIDGVGFGPLRDLPETGPIGEATLMPDFELVDPQSPVTDPYSEPVHRTPSRMRARGKNDYRIPAIVISAVLAIGVVAVLLWTLVFRDMWIVRNSDPVSVLPVSLLTGLEADTRPKYTGVVEPEETVSVTKDATKTVKEVYVDVGDQVSVGQPLFSYDTDEAALSLRQAELDLEYINSTITTLNDQVRQLEEQRNSASESDRASYTLQINAAQLDIRAEEYNLEAKQLEIEQLYETIENAEVASAYNGVIKELNLSEQVDTEGQEKPFISIQISSNYRVAGIISEQNIGLVYEGQQVVIRSRVDAEMAWSGTVKSIDLENPVLNDSNLYYYDESIDGNNQTTKFNFYVVLSSYEGLILGQHVYIELVPQSNTSMEGLWIPASYIVHEDGKSYAWVRGENETLTDQELILGSYDAGSDLYQIISGLTTIDYIAFPTEECKRGVPTVITYDVDYNNDVYDTPDDNYDSSIYDFYDDDSSEIYDDSDNYNGTPDDDTSSNGDSYWEFPNNDDENRQLYDAEGNAIDIGTNAHGALPEVS